MDSLIRIARPSGSTDKDKIARILVVDDEAYNRELLNDLLERKGFEILLAKDGEEALAVLDKNPIDLVLLDLMMPNLDGYGVLERMRADTRMRHIPVLVISAMSQEDASIRSIELGAQDFLLKPFNTVLLQARINSCLERKGMRDLELRYRRELEEEKGRVNDLLEGLFPAMVVRELKQTGTFRPRKFQNVAVMFCDIVGFTAYCNRNEPEDVVGRLQELTKVFETIYRQHKLEKLKLIGDGFLATAGLLESHDTPVLSSARCGLDLIDAVKAIMPDWSLRVGIHFGDVLAGVVGTKQYWFDIWGDTVNTASRIEEYGDIGAVSVSGFAWQQIDHICRGEVRVVDIHGKGPMEIVKLTEIARHRSR